MDDYENLPLFGKVSLAACLGYRVLRPTCSCCGGDRGVRRARRRYSKFQDFTVFRPYKLRSKGRKPKRDY